VPRRDHAVDGNPATWFRDDLIADPELIDVDVADLPVPAHDDAARQEIDEITD
jgi:hypothetical protein